MLSNSTQPPLPDSSAPDQSPSFSIEPYTPSKLEFIKKILQAHKKSLIIGLISILIIASTALAFIPPIQLNLSQAALDSAEKKDIFSSLLYHLEKSSPQPSPSVSSSLQPVIPSPTPSPALSPSPSPSPSPNPPRLTISYPSENQSISMDNSQTLCLVDIPNGNTSGLQRKHKINNQSWASYANHYTLCFDPQEGSNTISLQYKNSSGAESTIYTRNFSFHRIQNITINISGRIYQDNNCNASMDAQENFLKRFLCLLLNYSGKSIIDYRS